jgi:EF-P beta-lysylation protein EpmB
MADEIRRSARGFSLLVPRPYLDRIQPGNPTDPLLLQVLPQPAELLAASGFTTDPLLEADSTRDGGLLSKYQGRVLIVATGGCAVHCRYCFRRHFPYDDKSSAPADWQATLDAIAADASISEVILSGGDPLALDDGKLAELSKQLAEIPHLRRLRVHTRLPIVIPQRVTPELIAWLRGCRLTPIVVVQTNHPAELDAAVAEALGRLVDAGIPLLSQSVLLRGVNDRADVLAALCLRLVDLRVMPYYLHQMDRVAGGAHFEVPQADGKRLIEELRRRLPGYAVPRYVRETPGGASKQALA